MHDDGNRIYGRHMIIHYGQNVKSLEIFKDFVVQGLVNCCSRIRTFLEDYNMLILIAVKTRFMLNY